MLIGEAKLADAIVPTRIPGLSLVPATVDLSGAELELADMPRRNFILKDALDEYSAHGGIPFLLCADRLPAVPHLADLNAMAAADAVMVPLQCEFFALEGLSQLMKTIELVRDKLNPRSGNAGHRADHVRQAQQAVATRSPTTCARHWATRSIPP